eukprot:5996261-Pyramimonas_sp.AAC.1
MAARTSRITVMADTPVDDQVVTRSGSAAAMTVSHQHTRALGLVKRRGIYSCCCSDWSNAV